MNNSGVQKDNFVLCLESKKDLVLCEYPRVQLTCTFHLQQGFFLMGWALRTTVVSLTLSSCSINTLNKHTAARQHAAAPPV